MCVYECVGSQFLSTAVDLRVRLRCGACMRVYACVGSQFLPTGVGLCVGACM